jgi:hypothetical protein
MNYQSRARFLGLPLVHVTTGTRVDGVYRRGIAKGWVAIGDISFGVLLSFGGISVGGVSVGGLAIGVLSVGGLALGIGSIGGLGIGVLAVGGAAFGWSAALGGLAVARDFATGGAAVARHANDALATEYFAAQPFFRAATWLMDYSIALVFIPVLIGLVARIRQKSRPTPLHPPT